MSRKSHKRAEAVERFRSKGFRESVSNVVIGIDVRDLQLIGVDVFAYKVVFNVNMLDTRVEGGVAGKDDGAVVVAKEGSGVCGWQLRGGEEGA